MIPKDPNMLLSYVNLKLRDYYSDFEALCDDLDISTSETEEKLNNIGYLYNREKNQFIFQGEN